MLTEKKLSADYKKYMKSSIPGEQLYIRVPNLSRNDGLVPGCLHII